MVISYRDTEVKLTTQEYAALDEMGKLDSLYELLTALAGEDSMGVEVSEVNDIDGLMGLLDNIFKRPEEE